MAIILFGESKASCCEHCKFYHSGRSICIINAKFIIDEYEEPEKCPVVEFSAPNGRLIDADELLKTIEANDYLLRYNDYITERGMFTSGIKLAIAAAQTIIKSS